MKTKISGIERQRDETSLPKNHVPVAAIMLDEATQVRCGTDTSTVEEYAEAWGDGRDFPAVDLFTPDGGKTYYIGDGWHRCHAAVRADATSIAAEVHDGGEREARIFAAGANQCHGVRRTNADKRRAVEVMLEYVPGWSNRKIAEHVGVSLDLANRVRHEMQADGTIDRTTSRTGRDGRSQGVNDSFTPPAASNSAEAEADGEAGDCLTHGPSQPADDTTDDPLAALIAEYREAENAIAAVARKVKELANAEPAGNHLKYMAAARIKDHFAAAKAALRQCTPAEPCECEAGCNNCRNTGFLTRQHVRLMQNAQRR